MNPIRVLLVDDHEMLTEALAARLSTAPDMWVVGRCTTEDLNSVELVTLLQPDVITIEVTTAADAATLFTRFRAAWPPTHIVVLTASRNPAQAVAAARAGADGWVSKESSVETLAGVLRRAGRGQACFPPEQLGPILRELRADIARTPSTPRTHCHEEPLDVLTRRERAVLLGLVKGLRTADIAAELGVAANTVRTHTNKIFSKLNVHSRLEAARVARLAGMQPNTEQPTAPCAQW